MAKTQNTIETLILISVILIIFVAVFMLFFNYFNTSGVEYLSSPYLINNLKFFNFSSQQSTCSFDFSYSLNEYNTANQSDLSFILSNGVKIIPEYSNYSNKVVETALGVYTYTYNQNKPLLYNSSVCTSIAQSINKQYYVKYIERKLSDGYYVVQPSEYDYVFSVNNKNSNPSSLFNNNTVYLDSSLITASGIVSVKYKNGTSVRNNPFTFGEYLYLQSGNYTISYSNESLPVAFISWNYSGGVFISNQSSQTTSMMVINNGEIFVNLRSLLQAPEYFYISPNVTHQLYGKIINVHVDSPKKGFYTFYVNSEPYSGCVKTINGICNITENNGNYTVSAIFENSTQYAVSYPIVINFYSPPYVTLSGTYINDNVTLYADVKNGYGNSTYTFYYSNGSIIASCKDIRSSTCEFQALIPPHGIKITVYNPASSIFDGVNGAQVELNPNLKYFGIKNLGYDRFFYGSSELYSWCENNCSSNIPNVWVNIPSGIAGGQKITITLNESIDINKTFRCFNCRSLRLPIT